MKGESMKIQITIDCENDAFQDDPFTEIARILSRLTERFQDDRFGFPSGPIPLRDMNGNKVGTFKVKA